MSNKIYEENNVSAIASSLRSKGAVGKNLFNQEQLLNATGWTKNSDNYYNGTFNNLNIMFGNSTNGFTFYNNFKSNTQYTLTFYAYSNTGNGNPRFFIYYNDGTRERTSYINTTTSTQYTLTSSASKTIQKITFDFGDGYDNVLYLKDLQLEEGSSATPYQQYQHYKIADMSGAINGLQVLKENTQTQNPLNIKGIGCLKDYKVWGNAFQSGTPTPSNPVPIEAVGEYENGKYKIDVVSRVKNLFNKDDRTLGKIVNRDNGNISNADNYDVTDFIEVEPNTSYTFTGFNTWYTACYDNNKTYIGYMTNTSTMTTLANTKYIRTSILKANVDIGQIEKGSSASTFEAYHTPLHTPIYLDKPLYKIGNVSDYIDFENGKVVRNCGLKVFTGSESISIYTSSSTRTVLVVSHNISDIESYTSTSALPNLMATKFIQASQSSTWVNGMISRMTSDSRIVFILGANATTSDLQTIITNMPMVYKLSTPTQENITLPDIPLFNNVNTIVEVDNATGMYGKYWEIV